MRLFTKTIAVLAMAGTGLGVVGAQAQQLIIPPSVNSQAYQSTSYVWDGFYIGGQASLIGMKSHEANPGLPAARAIARRYRRQAPAFSRAIATSSMTGSCSASTPK